MNFAYVVALRAMPDLLKRRLYPYEPEVEATLRRNVPAGALCVDVGAHVGNVTEMLLRFAGRKGRVVAFEPHPQNVAELQKRFRTRRVTVVPKAVTDGVDRRLALHAGRGNASSEWNVVGHDVGGTPTDVALEVEATSLDAYFAAAEDVGVVKIDVEGAEHLVLAGMRRLLRASKPILIVEFHDEAGWRGRHELLEAGYTLWTLAGKPIEADAPRVYHVLARPPG